MSPQKDHATQRHWGAAPTPNDTRAPPERVRVTDVSAEGRGRAYLVERELEQDGHAALLALVADYISQGELHGAVPMTAPADRWLDHINDAYDGDA